MSELPGGEAPKEPYIVRTSIDGSTAEIHTPERIIEEAQKNGIIVYDRADFGTPIERAQLALRPIRTEADELAVGFAADIQLDRSRGDTASLETQLKKKMIPPQTSRLRSDVVIGKTTFDNAFAVEDAHFGTRAIAVISNGRVVIQNDATFTSANPDVEDKLEIRAPVVGTVSEEDYLKGMARIMMFTLDRIKKSNEMSLNPRGLNRTYRIGEYVEPNGSSPVPQGLGRTAQRGVATPPQQPRLPEKSHSEPSVEEEFGIDIVPGEVTLDDIGGLPLVKEKLREIAVSFSNPDIMKKWGAARPQGLLLYGEPGTGKTMLVEALAHEIGAEVWAIQGSDIYDKWLGESERKIKKLFERARELEKPTIILFDEFDSMIGVSENPGAGGAGQARNAVAGVFKQEMNTLAAENPNVLVVATTNHPDRIDQALIRSGRFDYKVYVPMPDDEARAEIVSGIVTRAIMDNSHEDFAPYGDDIDVSQVVRETDGMSGADISEIFRRLTLEKAMQEARTGSAQSIVQEDIIRTIRVFKTQG